MKVKQEPPFYNLEDGLTAAQIRKELRKRKWYVHRGRWISPYAKLAPRAENKALTG